MSKPGRGRHSKREEKRWERGLGWGGGGRDAETAGAAKISDSQREICTASRVGIPVQKKTKMRNTRRGVSMATGRSRQQGEGWGRSEGRGTGESISWTCAGRPARAAGKLHVNKSSKRLPPTALIPPDSAAAVVSKRADFSTWASFGIFRAAAPSLRVSARPADSFLKCCRVERTLNIYGAAPLQGGRVTVAGAPS